MHINTSVCGTQPLGGNWSRNNKPAVTRLWKLTPAPRRSRRNILMKLVPSVLLYDPIGDLAALSNYSKHPVCLDELEWPTVEHFFQASKFKSPEIRRLIIEAETPYAAKELAWQVDPSSIRVDWLSIRREIMEAALTEKFKQHKDAACVLRNTWPCPIYEDSLDDSYWGIGHDGLGQNHLGRLLMRVRSSLMPFFNDDKPPMPSVRPRHQNESRFGFIDAQTWKPPNLKVNGNKVKLQSVLSHM